MKASESLLGRRFRPEKAPADAVAFGRSFIANPDLVERIAGGYPRKPYDRSTSCGGARGYTGYGTWQAEKSGPPGPVNTGQQGELSASVRKRCSSLIKVRVACHLDRLNPRRARKVNRFKVYNFVPGGDVLRIIFLALALHCNCHGLLFAQPASSDVRYEIPKAWDEAELKAWTIPARDSGAYTVHVPPSFYYTIPAPRIYKSYPVYHPSKEPAGYMDWLRREDPQVVFDSSTLRTEAEWIAAGRLVFEDPRFNVPVEMFRDLRWYEQLKIPLTVDGVVPGWRYVVRKKGVVEAGAASCSACHSRVMPDGSLLNGAQGNFPTERDLAWDIRLRRNLADARKYTSGLSGLSFATGRFSFLEKETADMDVDQIASVRDAIPPGVVLRAGVSILTPVKIADLIGVKDRRYLDLIARVQHRNIGDLMRYAAFQPGEVVFFADRAVIPARKLPDSAALSRFSDEQLFALSLYIYSLQPPRNSNLFDEVARRGQKVFERESCAGCHTPPLYTNNKLTLAGDFVAPADHLTKYDILLIRVGTDPRSALQAMRGTGYYKVPSLKGVWYRGPFEHNGSIATLEDWFDPRRLRDDYVPTGFKGYGVKTRAVKGHQFGLRLSSGDKQALIAFLRTL